MYPCYCGIMRRLAEQVACVLRITLLMKTGAHSPVQLHIRGALYVKHNLDARSCHYCCCGKAMSITYSGSVFVASGIQHVMRIRLMVIHSLHGCTIVSSLAHKRHFFLKKKKLLNKTACFNFLYNFCPKCLSFRE